MITKNMTIRARQLCILTKRLVWGSEEQIEAETELCQMAEPLNPGYEAEVFRMTTDERADYSLDLIEQEYRSRVDSATNSGE